VDPKSESTASRRSPHYRGGVPRAEMAVESATKPDEGIIINEHVLKKLQDAYQRKRNRWMEEARALYGRCQNDPLTRIMCSDFSRA